MATVTAHQPAYTRHFMNSLGLWLFIVSEAGLFSVFIFTRYYLTGTDQPEDLNLAIGFGISALLLTSSACAYMAERSIGRGNRTAFVRFTFAAVALGVIFLVGVGLEWAEALDAFAPPDLYGSVFFALTGLHAAHMVTGMLGLSFVGIQGLRGSYGPDEHWGVTGAVRYWHFVDVVWLVVFPTLYLV